MPIFLNPAYIGALGLAAIPLLVHLIRRRRVKVVPWAAWDFLQQSRRRNRRRLRVEQLLLLLIRIAIVTLVALAFCRPLLRAVGLPLVAADARVHALIVLDNSYSMGYKRDGMTDFERARRVADEIVAKVLKAGDSVSVVLLSAKPEALLGAPTFDLAKARERLRGADTKISDRDTDFGMGAAYCATLLKEVRTPTKEVYWITDSQRSGFRDTGQARAQEAWKELAGEARLTWIDVSGAGRDNLSVDTPAFSRELVTPQAPVRIEAAIHNYGPAQKTNLLVNLTVDGRAAGSARVNVPAHGAAKASFVYLFDKAGVHTGTIQLSQPDALARDNTAWFSAKVRDRLRTLIVDPHPAADPVKDEAFYLATALSPVAASEGGRSVIQTTVHPGTSLAGINLRSFDAIVITGLDAVSPTDRTALQEYVRNGGGLLLFPGPATDVARVNASLGSGERFLPARLGARRAYPGETAPTINAASITHPALALFRDTSDIDIGSARFTTVYDLTPTADDAATQVLCRFSGGQPALVQRLFGQGKVILAASSAGTGGGDLPYKPAFVPLVHQLVAYLAAGPNTQRNVHVGEPLSARFDVADAGKPLRLTDPAGNTTLQNSTLGADGVVFRTAATEQAGIYRIGLAGRDMVDAFAVNLPPDESDLASATAAQVQAALGPVRVQFARAGDDLQSVVRQARHGTEVWRPLVMAAVVLLFAEAGLAWLFGRRG